MIDLINQYCIYVDYPLFRNWLKKYRSKFNKVILYASKHHGVIDLEQFAREQIKETWVSTDIDWTTLGIDWRQAETEPCLELSDAEWILFVEQDFFCDNWEKLWTDVEKAMQDADAIGWWNETHFSYLHPCFLLIKREALDKTRKDFRAHPEVYGCDHFGMITSDLLRNGAKIVKLQDLGWTEPEHAFHLGGLTYPYQNFKDDETIIGVKYPEAFHEYNHKVLESDTDVEFKNLAFKLDTVLDKKDIIPDPKWEKFFND